jgi:hypothetical protein
MPRCAAGIHEHATHRQVTHLRPEEALALIELLDQLRDVLIQSYQDGIRAMLQEAMRERTGIQPEDVPF